MKNSFSNGALVAVSMIAFAACSTQDEMDKPAAATPAPAAAPAPAPAAAEAKAGAEKAPEKAKATKLAGDVGLLDTEKNYMILVTKEGKLVTIDFDAKYQPLQREYVDSKVAEIGLGSAAVVQYTKDGDKSVATNIEYVPAKGE